MPDADPASLIDPERLAALHRLERSRARFSVLATASGALTSTLNPLTVLERLSRLVVPDLADWCVAYAVDALGVVRQRAGRHRDSARQADLRRFLELVPDRVSDTGSVWRPPTPGRPWVLPRADAGLLAIDPAVPATDAAEVAELADRLGIRSIMVVPLVGRQKVLGGLLLVSADGPVGDDRDATMTTVDLAGQAGLALDNARLFGHQRRTAEVLQRSLLGELPPSPGIELTARYLPATDDTAIGGDWYDAFTAPDGSLYLVIGDVVGHDLQAAAAMGRVRQLLQTIAFDRAEPPAAILRRVDTALEGLRIATFATTVVARLDPPSDQDATVGRRLVWSNAGHPPPVLALPGGPVQALDREPEVLLGAMLPDRTDHQIMLPPGATLVLYTDGLVERRDSPLDHGLARLRQALARVPDMPLPQLCDHLLDRLVPGRSQDDVAVLAVRISHPTVQPE